MNILFVIPTLGHGGAQKTIVDLCKMIVNSSHHTKRNEEINSHKYENNVSLATLAKENVIPHFFETPDGVKVFTTNTYSNHKVVSALRMCAAPFRLRHIVKANSIDIIISFQDIANFPVLLGCAFLRTRIIVSERQDTRFYNFPGIRSIARCLLYPLASRIVVQTELIRKQMPNKVKSKTIVIPNACPSFTTRADPEKAISFKYRALTVGRLEKQKNLEFLVASGPEIFSQCDDWCIDIYGSGSLAEKLADDISNLSLENNIFLCKPTKNIEQTLSMYNLFVFPSLYEGFPNALAEAVAAGLPTIAYSDVSGVAELISHNKTGLILDRDQTHTQELSKAMITLMKDDERRIQMGKAAIQLAQRFNSKKIYSQWSQVVSEELQFIDAR